MSTNLGSANFSIVADLSQLVTGIASAKGLVGGLGAVFAGATVAAAGLTIEAVKMAGDFQQSMTQLVTGAGESQKNLGMVSDGILAMAPKVGTSTQDLAAGMYMIESAGFHGAAALQILTAASEGAKVGNANLADVANGVTTAMTDYAASGLTAAQATNDLIATVAAGKTHMGDLATAMSTILPTSAAVGVSFTDVSAAMATMTGEGTNAAAAATYLRQMLLAMDAPSAAAVKTLASIGLTSADVSTEMKTSLPGALALIEDHLKSKFPEGSAAYVAAMKDIAGGSRTLQAWLELTGTHLGTLEGNVKDITGAVQQGGASITGWALVQHDFNFQLDQAQAAVQVLGIKFGTVLLPAVTGVFNWISTNVFPVLSQLETAFGLVFGPTPQATVQQHGATIQAAAANHGVYNTALTDGANATDQHAAATQKAAANHGVYNTALTQGASDIAKAAPQINPFLDIMKQVATVVRDDVIPTLDKFGGWIVSTGLPTLEKFSGWFVKDALPILGGFATTLQQNVLPLVESLIGNVMTLGENFIGWLQSSGTLTGVLDALGGVLGTVATVVGTVVGWFKDGGPPLYILIGAVTILGAAFVALKIADTAGQFALFFDKLKAGDGVVSNLADRFMKEFAPNAQKAFGTAKQAADDASISVKKVGDASSAAEGVVKTEATAMSTDLSTKVGEGAATAETEVEGIGIKATETEGVVATESESMSTDLSTKIGEGTAAADLSIAGVGTQTTETAGVVATEATGMGFSMGALGPIGIGIGLLIPLIQNVAASSKQMIDGVVQNVEDAAKKAQDATNKANKAIEDSTQNTINQLNQEWGSYQPIIATADPTGAWAQVSQQDTSANKAHGQHGAAPGHASGGVIPAGQYGMVDDQPGAGNNELMYGGSSGISVLPAGPSASLLGGGSSGDVHTHLYIDSKEFAHIIGNRMVKEIRAKVGLRR